MNKIYLIAFSVTFLNLIGCSSISKLNYNDSKHNCPFFHTVTFNWRGQPIDPSGNRNLTIDSCEGEYNYVRPPRPLNPKQYEGYLKNVFKGRELFYERTKNPKVLIFIHGGLNTLDGSIKRAIDLHNKIENSGSDSYYPIFINWQSSLMASYADHLFNVRQGQEANLIEKYSLFPFYFLVDTLRGVGRAPLTWYYQIKNNLESFQTFESQDEEALDRIISMQKKKFRVYDGAGCPNNPCWSDAVGDCRDCWEMTTSSLTWFVTLPTKIFTAPFIDGYGTSAWDNMLRTTHLLFHSDEDFWAINSKDHQINHQVNDSEISGIGGLSVFMRSLQKKIKDHPEAWNITLIGHSMGAIIANEMLRRFENINYNTIVYMAAASSIRDYEDSVFPYLLNKEHSQTKFYHLMLHNEAEVRDRWEGFPGFIDLPIRGSLLVWIDNFFTKPETILDRRAGRWSNLARAVHNTPPEIRDRLTFKIFRAGDSVIKSDPQKHGDFNDFPFWIRQFWTEQVDDIHSIRRMPH